MTDYIAVGQIDYPDTISKDAIMSGICASYSHIRPERGGIVYINPT